MGGIVLTVTKTPAVTQLGNSRTEVHAQACQVPSCGISTV